MRKSKLAEVDDLIRLQVQHHDADNGDYDDDDDDYMIAVLEEDGDDDSCDYDDDHSDPHILYHHQPLRGL